MMMNNGFAEKILIVVDMQKDFVDGSLGTPEAQAIVPNVDKLIESGKFQEVYYTFDTHYGNYLETREGQKLPVKHCLFGTAGWGLMTKHFPENASQQIIKHTFGYLGWDRKLNPARVKEITIVGLCTDICVVSNALILKAYCPNTKIICDASCCAGTTPEAHKAALAVMKSCQIDVINE